MKSLNKQTLISDVQKLKSKGKDDAASYFMASKPQISQLYPSSEFKELSNNPGYATINNPYLTQQIIFLMPTFVFNLMRMVGSSRNQNGRLKKSNMYRDVIIIKYNQKTQHNQLKYAQNVTKRDIQSTNNPRFSFQQTEQEQIIFFVNQQFQQSHPQWIREANYLPQLYDAAITTISGIGPTNVLKATVEQFNPQLIKIFAPPALWVVQMVDFFLKYASQFSKQKLARIQQNLKFGYKIRSGTAQIKSGSATKKFQLEDPWGYKITIPAMPVSKQILYIDFSSSLTQSSQLQITQYKKLEESTKQIQAFQNTIKSWFIALKETGQNQYKKNMITLRTMVDQQFQNLDQQSLQTTQNINNVATNMQINLKKVAQQINTFKSSDIDLNLALQQANKQILSRQSQFMGMKTYFANIFQTFQGKNTQMSMTQLNKLPKQISLQVLHNQRIRRVQQTEICAKCTQNINQLTKKYNNKNSLKQLQDFFATKVSGIQQLIMGTFQTSSNNIKVLRQKGNRLLQQFQSRQQISANNKSISGQLSKLRQTADQLFSGQNSSNQALKNVLAGNQTMLNGLVKGLQTNKLQIAQLSVQMQQKLSTLHNATTLKMQQSMNLTAQSIMGTVRQLQSKMQTNYLSFTQSISDMTKNIEDLVRKVDQVIKQITNITGQLKIVQQISVKSFQSTNKLTDMFQTFMNQIGQSDVNVFKISKQTLQQIKKQNQLNLEDLKLSKSSVNDIQNRINNKLSMFQPTLDLTSFNNKISAKLNNFSPVIDLNQTQKSIDQALSKFKPNMNKLQQNFNTSIYQFSPNTNKIGQAISNKIDQTIMQISPTINTKALDSIYNRRLSAMQPEINLSNINQSIRKKISDFQPQINLKSIQQKLQQALPKMDLVKYNQNIIQFQNQGNALNQLYNTNQQKSFEIQSLLQKTQTDMVAPLQKLFFISQDRNVQNLLQMYPDLFNSLPFILDNLKQIVQLNQSSLSTQNSIVQGLNQMKDSMELMALAVDQKSQQTIRPLLEQNANMKRQIQYLKLNASGNGNNEQFKKYIDGQQQIIGHAITTIQNLINLAKQIYQKQATFFQQWLQYQYDKGTINGDIVNDIIANTQSRLQARIQNFETMMKGGMDQSIIKRVKPLKFQKNLTKQLFKWWDKTGKKIKL